MSLSRFLAPAAVAFVMALRASAETHTLKFVNQCGSGSPVLMLNGKNVLDSNGMYTSNGPYSGIGYLQTGGCNTNGEGCTLLETTLINPTCAGCGGSTDISLIPPHEFNVLTSFSYYDGCDGQGKLCASEQCTDVAFFTPTDYFAQVACQVDNVNLLVAFCANASELVLGGGNLSNSPPPSSSLSSSSTPPFSSTPNVDINASSPPPSSSTPTPIPSSPPPSVNGSSNPGCPAPSLSSVPPSSLPPSLPTPSVNNNDAFGNSSVPPSSTPTPAPTPSVPPPYGSSSLPPLPSSSGGGDPNVDPNVDLNPSSVPPGSCSRNHHSHSSSYSHSHKPSSSSSTPPFGSPSGSTPIGTPTPSTPPVDLAGTPSSCSSFGQSSIPQRRRHRRNNFYN